jgi:GGDEF domain-containing protein
MDAALRGAAARVARRRHHSFSDAVDGVLAELERALPTGTVFLGLLEDAALRVTDTRGEAVPGLADARELSVTDGAVPEPEQLRDLGVRSFVAVPLETSDGHHVGSLCAAGVRPGLYEQAHLDLLTVLARLLAREWEVVRFRAELLGLGERLRDREGAHPVTGLTDRARLMESLVREWGLSRRGTLASQLMLCRIEGLDRVRAEKGEAMASLLLKDLAEALAGSLREVDHCGHVSDEILAGVLVGCPTPEDGERAVSRLRGVIGRVLAARPVELRLAFTVSPLQDVASPRQLLQDAEAKVHAAEALPAVAVPVGDAA